MALIRITSSFAYLVPRKHAAPAPRHSLPARGTMASSAEGGPSGGIPGSTSATFRPWLALLAPGSC